MHQVDRVAGPEQLDFSPAGRSAAHMNTRDGPTLAQNNGTSCCCLEVGIVSDLQSRHLSQRSSHNHTSAKSPLGPHHREGLLQSSIRRLGRHSIQAGSNYVSPCCIQLAALAGQLPPLC